MANTPTMTKAMRAAVEAMAAAGGKGQLSGSRAKALAEGRAWLSPKTADRLVAAGLVKLTVPGHNSLGAPLELA